jgi:hypothetical protein
MNERIRKLAKKSGFSIDANNIYTAKLEHLPITENMEKFAELIVRECADICMEMAAKCAGLPGDGALAKDCADWIKKDFGVEE